MEICIFRTFNALGILLLPLFYVFSIISNRTLKLAFCHTVIISTSQILYAYIFSPSLKFHRHHWLGIQVRPRFDPWFASRPISFGQMPIDLIYFIFRYFSISSRFPYWLPYSYFSFPIFPVIMPPPIHPSGTCTQRTYKGRLFFHQYAIALLSLNLFVEPFRTKQVGKPSYFLCHLLFCPITSLNIVLFLSCLHFVALNV